MVPSNWTSRCEKKKNPQPSVRTVNKINLTVSQTWPWGLSCGLPEEGREMVAHSGEARVLRYDAKSAIR